MITKKKREKKYIKRIESNIMDIGDKAVRYKKREDKNGEITDRKEGEKGRGGERIREGEERKKEEGNTREIWE